MVALNPEPCAEPSRQPRPFAPNHWKGLHQPRRSKFPAGCRLPNHLDDVGSQEGKLQDAAEIPRSISSALASSLGDARNRGPSPALARREPGDDTVVQANAKRIAHAQPKIDQSFGEAISRAFALVTSPQAQHIYTPR